MEMGGELHALTALYPGHDPVTRIERRAKQTLELV